jgi:hypothetical protein
MSSSTSNNTTLDGEQKSKKRRRVFGISAAGIIGVGVVAACLLGPAATTSNFTASDNSGQVNISAGTLAVQTQNFNNLNFLGLGIGQSQSQSFYVYNDSSFNTTVTLTNVHLDASPVLQPGADINQIQVGIDNYLVPTAAGGIGSDVSLGTLAAHTGAWYTLNVGIVTSGNDAQDNLLQGSQLNAGLSVVLRQI